MIKKFTCPRCSGIDVYADKRRGDVVCILCGEVIASRIIDESSEWNEYLDDDQDRGKFLARANSYINKNSIMECETTLIGGSSTTRKNLLKTQNMMESNLDKKIIAHMDTLWQIGAMLKLSQSLQVSAYNFALR